LRSAKAVLVGALWTGFNLLFDYPMFAFGPMQMTVGKYYSEIGLSYLAFPALASGGAPGAPMKASTEQDYYERIVRALVFIQAHLDDELEPEQVAAVAAFRNSTLRVFFAASSAKR